ncbi:MAG: hypothetical protein WC071_01755 [Victivallaceae bacterium]
MFSLQSKLDEFNTVSGIAIQFEKFDKQYYELLEYLKYTDRQICKYLGTAQVPNALNVQIVIVQRSVKNNMEIICEKRNIKIYLNSNINLLKNDFKINRMLITTLILAKNGINPETGTEVPGWLIAGIYGGIKAKEKEQSVIQLLSLPGLNALVAAEKLPNFKSIIDTPMTPEQDGVSYLLYEEACRFILDSINNLSQRADNPLADIIVLNASNKYTREEVFNSTVGRVILAAFNNKNTNPGNKNLSDSEKIQLWFERNAKYRLTNYYNPLPADIIEKKFVKFRELKYFLDKERKMQKIADLIQLPRIFDEIDHGNVLVAEKSIELSELINLSPPLTIPPLKAIAQDLAEIGKVPAAVGSRRLERNLLEAEKAIKRQSEIECRLDKIQNTEIPAAQLYRAEIIELQRENAGIWPAMTTFLQKVEKSYMEN